MYVSVHISIGKKRVSQPLQLRSELYKIIRHSFVSPSPVPTGSVSTPKQ